jgi:hypothetical protein
MQADARPPPPQLISLGSDYDAFERQPVFFYGQIAADAL